MAASSQVCAPFWGSAEQRAAVAPPRSVLIAAVLATAGLVVATLIGEIAAQPATWVLAVDIAAGVLGCGAILLLPRWPITASVFLVLLAGVSPAATPPVAAATLGITLRRSLRAGAVVAGAATVAQILRAVLRPTTGLPLGWWAVIVVTSQAALLGWGAVVQARRALIDSLQERVHRAESEQARRVAEARLLERTRIAGEMHDVLAHRLSLLSTYAGALEYHPGAPPDQLAKAATVIRDSAHQALQELREVIGVLRYEPGSVGTGQPQPTLSDVAALIEECRDAGMRVDLQDGTLDAAEVPTSTGRTVYRIVQEGLTNARKHAADQPVRVQLGGVPGGQLTVDISNSLPRCPQAPTAPGSGTGLIGLIERVVLAEGELQHGPDPNGAWRLTARLPWPP
ncbi:MAG: sensor histidine kinase [Pseudonocardiaceae bacterium]